MEYLKPIESLERNLNFFRKLAVALVASVILLAIILPDIAKKSNPIVIKTAQSAVIAEVSSWDLSRERLERFTKMYLSDRFEWGPDNFENKRNALKELTSESVFSKLKSPISSFESLAKLQGARSYYVLEDFGFSNSKKTLQAQITRVIRIKSAALATPLRIVLNYDETSISDANPFGMTVVGLDEAEITSDEK